MVPSCAFTLFAVAAAVPVFLASASIEVLRRDERTVIFTAANGREVLV